MWQGVLGHDDVVEQFRRSLKAGRLASCYLFLGPAGVGKRALALQLARALLCQNSPEDSLDPCGNCESCRQADAGSHPDISVVGLPAGKRQMPVELFLGDRDHRNQVGLCHDISLRPKLGRRRVAVIDDADHLTVESSNCLLKTLEEPPRGAVIILLATSRSRLLPTILSRTQIVRFAELQQEAARQLLLEQQIVQDEREAAELAAQSGGSLARARQLADGNLGEIRDWLLPRLSPQAFDALQISRQLQDYVNGAGKEAQAKRERMRLLFQVVGETFSRILRYSIQRDDCANPADKSAQSLAEELGPAASDCALAMLERCLDAEEQLDRNANQATLLECWLDDLGRILSDAQAIATN